MVYPRPMQLNCAYVRGHSVLVGTITVPSNASLEQLGRVVRKTATSKLSTPEDAVLSLRLTKTPSSDVAPHSSSWLERDTLPLIDAPLVERGCFKLPDDAAATGEAVLCSALFGSGFVFEQRDIHVVAIIIDDDDRDGAGPPRKRVCAWPCQYIRPRAVLDWYCVPLDTIDAFQDVRVALTLRGPKPVVLLQGPPFSGKTTISKGICEWIQESAWYDGLHRTSIQPINFVSKATMWMQLSRGIGLMAQCADKTSFFEALTELSRKWYVVVDQLDVLLAKPALATQFFAALREMRALPNFGGFLGIGRGDLQSLLRGDQELFDESVVVEAKPFSEQQVLDLFSQVGLDNGFFSVSTGRKLVEYSGGSPGVLGSLLELMASPASTFTEGVAWEEWFENEGFAQYVSRNAKMFRSLRDEWRQLTRLSWLDLVGVVERRRKSTAGLGFVLLRGDLKDIQRRLAEAKQAIDSGNHCDGYARMCLRIRVLYLQIIH